MRLASWLVSDEERWGFAVQDPAAGEDWLVEPELAEAFLASYARIPSSGLLPTQTRFLDQSWPDTLVGLLELEEPGMAALSRLATAVERFARRSDATILPRSGHPISAVELLAPIPRPRLYWGLVTNSPSFVRNRPGIAILNLFPLGHQRPQGAAIGHGQPILMRHDHHLPQFAYNVELAVVIGKAGRYIPIEEAMDHVAGYTVVDDASGNHFYRIVPGSDAETAYALPDGYQDWLYQATASWGGKKADTLAPMGPYLVTKDEIVDPYDLLMYTRESGRTRDRAHSGSSLMGIERIIAWYSSFASLYPGDVIHLGTMGVDGLPVRLGGDAPAPRLEVEIEGIGTLANPVRTAEHVVMEQHPSYAVRQAARSAPRIEAPEAWTAGSARHLYTVFGNDESSEREDGLAPLEVPRFLNGPASSLAASGSVVEIPPRATELTVSIELAAVVGELTSDAQDGATAVLGYTPLIAVCDQSFADDVVEPARTGERGIPVVYGRWADGFTIVAPSPIALPAHDWRGRAMMLRVGDREVHGSTDTYLDGPSRVIETISAMITLFPGDVITLGATAARIRMTPDSYADGVTVTGAIDGIGEIRAELIPR